MKLKHTQARKARRASAIVETGNSKCMSKARFAKRWDSIKAKAASKTFGCQKAYVQRIFLKKDRFGAPIYKFVPHAVIE